MLVSWRPRAGWRDAEHREVGGDSLELVEVGVAIDPNVRSSARRDSHILAQDRGAFHGIDLDEADGLTSAMAKECLPAGGADVARPFGALAEHRDQIALAIELGDDDREGDQPAAESATNLERRHSPGPDPRRERDRRHAVLHAGEQIRAVAIQPAKVIVVAGHASSMGVTVQVSQGRMSRRDSVDEVNVVRVGWSAGRVASGRHDQTR